MSEEKKNICYLCYSETSEELRCLNNPFCQAILCKECAKEHVSSFLNSKLIPECIRSDCWSIYGLNEIIAMSEGEKIVVFELYFNAIKNFKDNCKKSISIDQSFFDINKLPGSIRETINIIYKQEAEKGMKKIETLKNVIQSELCLHEFCGGIVTRNGLCQKCHFDHTKDKKLENIYPLALLFPECALCPRTSDKIKVKGECFSCNDGFSFNLKTGIECDFIEKTLATIRKKLPVSLKKYTETIASLEPKYPETKTLLELIKKEPNIKDYSDNKKIRTDIIMLFIVFYRQYHDYIRYIRIIDEFSRLADGVDKNYIETFIEQLKN